MQDHPIDHDLLDMQQSSASRQLYALLSLLLEGPALDSLMAIEPGEGLEAWRRICQDNMPRTVGHRRALLLKLLTPSHIEGSFLQKALRWEKEFADYKNLGGIELPQEVRMGVMQAVLCPQHVREHITYTVDRCLTWDQMRDEIHRVLMAKDT